MWLHLWYLQNCSDDRKFWSDSKVIISIKASFPTIFYVQNVDNSRQSLVFCELSEIHSCIYQEVFEETKVVIGIRKSKRDRQHNGQMKNGQMKKEKEQTTIYKTLHRKRKNVISAFYRICRHLNLKSMSDVSNSQDFKPCECCWNSQIHVPHAFTDPDIVLTMSMLSLIVVTVCGIFVSKRT